MISNKKGVQLIINILVKAGIKNVVLSPGSRNAPLSLSFEHHKNFDTIVIPDERSAAYFALGITLHTQTPTCIVCTSGSAGLNYSPAIAEAYYQRIPLIILTADRPSKWIDQGDGQTIRQENVFSNFVLESFTLNGDANSQDELNQAHEILNEAIILAIEKSGPVHINIPCEEPLYNMVNEKGIDLEFGLPIYDTEKLPTELIEDLSKILSTTKKILILVGQHHQSQELENILILLAKNSNIVVLTEATSNLQSEHFISCIDRTIDSFTNDEKIKFKPELLITIGGAIVSKKIKLFFRQNPPTYHWNINEFTPEMNTYNCLTHPISFNDEQFFNIFGHDSFSGERKFYEAWKNKAEINLEKHKKFIAESKFSDLKLFSLILDKIPSQTYLHLGNSSAIRYVLLFNPRKELYYFSNRGVSGIDGCTSTAVGMAYANNEQVTLISGDISFFYDSNALWNDYLKNIKIIVVNNGGGGIFRIIDQPENIKDTEKLFETRHHRSVKGITEAFQLKYFSANDEESLISGIEKLYADNSPAVLEIFTPTELNAIILKEYFEFLKTK